MRRSAKLDMVKGCKALQADEDIMSGTMIDVGELAIDGRPCRTYILCASSIVRPSPF